jgi:hypothetical protein
MALRLRRTAAMMCAVWISSCRRHATTAVPHPDIRQTNLADGRGSGCLRAACSGCRFDLPLPSPPAKQAAASQHQAGQASTHDGAGDGRRERRGKRRVSNACQYEVATRRRDSWPLRQSKAGHRTNRCYQLVPGQALCDCGQNAFRRSTTGHAKSNGCIRNGIGISECKRGNRTVIRHRSNP